MEKVVLKPFQHLGKEWIGIYFEINFKINGSLRKNARAKWNQTNRCWYVPLSKESYATLLLALKGIAIVDNSTLHQYLRDNKMATIDGRKASSDTTPASTLSKSGVRSGTTLKASIFPKSKSRDLTDGDTIQACNSHVIPAMEQQLYLKGYSESTIKTYSNELVVFLKTIQHHPADDFSIQRIKDYLQYCSRKLSLSENTLHCRMNALKFYYEQVLKREKFFWDIPRPKKAKLLPKVLSKEEMIRLLKVIENVKHKTMIMLSYACGLRVSEITALEIKDVDNERRLLLIRRAKGKKDRIVSLGPVMLAMLNEYRNKYKPEKYLFEGQFKDKKYSIRSLESIIKAGKDKAAIIKSGSMHMLRHSFATHLLEKGTDVVFIQKLLGHNNIKTTLKYLHVTNKDMLNILSPLEDIKDFL